MKKIKKLLLFFSILLLLSCFSTEEKAEKIKIPYFEHQKTYILKQNPFDFTTIYDVWKSNPVSVFDYPDTKSMLADRYFKARKKIKFSKNEFVITDLENNTRYFLVEEEPLIFKNKKLIQYKITDSEKTICSIVQKEEKDILNFEILVNNKYDLKGSILKNNNNIICFEFLILNPNKNAVGYILKKFRYFINEYEIIINKENKELSDPIFIGVAIFIDQILKENGFRYKADTF